MVKHKGKGLGGTEKSKKQKLTPAEETLRASEARPGKEGASPKVSDSARAGMFVAYWSSYETEVWLMCGYPCLLYTVMDQPGQVKGLGERGLLAVLPGIVLKCVLVVVQVLNV